MHKRSFIPFITSDGWVCGFWNSRNDVELIYLENKNKSGDILYILLTMDERLSKLV